jgi:hypothetical protein
MASSKTTSQAPRRRSTGLFTNFHEEDTMAQPPRQLGGHPPRVTNSRSLTRTNRNGELNTTYARIESKKCQGCSNPSLSNPTKATNARKELDRKNKGESQQMTPRSRSNGERTGMSPRGGE